MNTWLLRCYSCFSFFGGVFTLFLDKSKILNVAISKDSHTQFSEPCHQGFVSFLSSGNAHMRLTLSRCRTTTTTTTILILKIFFISG